MKVQDLMALARLQTYLKSYHSTSEFERKRLSKNIKDISGFSKQLRQRILKNKDEGTTIVFKIVTFSFSKEDVFFTGRWTTVSQNGLWIDSQNLGTTEQEPISFTLFCQTLLGELEYFSYPSDDIKNIDMEIHYIKF